MYFRRRHKGRLIFGTNGVVSGNDMYNRARVMSLSVKIFKQQKTI